MASTNDVVIAVSSQKELTVSDNPDSVSAIVLSLSLKYHSWKGRQLEIPYAMPERVTVGNSKSND